MVCAGIPQPSHKNQLLILLVVVSILYWIVVSLRFFVRIHISKSFWYDDWVMVVATVMQIGSCSVVFRQLHLGLGDHIWNLPHFSPERILELDHVSEPSHGVVQSPQK